MRVLSPLAAIFLLSVPIAFADPPARVPVQGYLTTSAGNPVEGPVQMQLKLYDDPASTTAFFTETQVANVQSGALTIYLGAVAPLDLRLFRRGVAHLGITLMGEAEMQPRLEIGSVPFAAYAQETAAVPPGAVMMFDLDNCPAGWTALAAARGRALVGTPMNGTRGGTVGIAFGNLENRVHAHSVDPDPMTTLNGGDHGHTVPMPGATTGPAGSHSHRWSSFNNTSKSWTTFDSAGASTTVIDWTQRGGEIGMDTVGGGNYPLASDDALLPSTFNYFTASTPNHSHSITGSTLTSSFHAGHMHSFDLGSKSSSTAATADVVPYLQLLVCRKD